MAKIKRCSFFAPQCIGYLLAKSIISFIFKHQLIEARLISLRVIIRDVKIKFIT